MAPKKIIKKLPTGITVHVNDQRVRVDLPSSSSSSSPASYESISSAILNGGCHTFPSSSPTTTTVPSTTTTTHQQHHVINYKVPATYDGVTPKPHGLLADFCHDETVDPNNTVGLLTTASMETFSTSSRNGRGIHVDVIVTAGLSNSRSSGADADYFTIVCDDDDNDGDDDRKMTPGTINTIVVVDTPLSPEARVEAYAIAIEAKCAACVDHGVSCAKDPTKFAMGTGTDCCALLSPCRGFFIEKDDDDDVGTTREKKAIVEYAGKHTLFAEMMGQAVYEATSKAIMINIRHLHANYALYSIRRCWRSFTATMVGATRPCIPPKPMDPIPNAPPSVILMGASCVLSMYVAPLPERTRTLLAAVVWDRYLGEVPIGVHPVCIAGRAIGKCVSLTPDQVYEDPVLGFVFGLVFMISMLCTFVCGGWIFVQCTDALATSGPTLFDRVCYSDGYCNTTLVNASFDLVAWILQLLLFKSAFSLQLLCTIALQMARFLERDQLPEARAQLMWLCSRDPSDLTSSDLAGATLESLSENLSDGFVAPLFWYVVLGPVGALGYRIANTLDSRVGYRGRYEWFGKPSARFDDLINIAPARITALLLAAAAAFARGRDDATRGLRTAWEDRRRCESPNAGWPMACFAGILGVRLRKEGAYCLGSRGVDPGPGNIRDGHEVAQIAGGMTVLLAAVATALIK